MFLSWDGFIDKLTQIFKDLKVEITAERKIFKLI